jgi:hypothetical protein
VICGDDAGADAGQRHHHTLLSRAEPAFGIAAPNDFRFQRSDRSLQANHRRDLQRGRGQRGTQERVFAPVAALKILAMPLGIAAACTLKRRQIHRLS